MVGVAKATQCPTIRVQRARYRSCGHSSWSRLLQRPSTEGISRSRSSRSRRMTTASCSTFTWSTNIRRSWEHRRWSTVRDAGRIRRRYGTHALARGVFLCAGPRRTRREAADGGTRTPVAGSRRGHATDGRCRNASWSVGLFGRPVDGAASPQPAHSGPPGRPEKERGLVGFASHAARDRTGHGYRLHVGIGIGELSSGCRSSKRYHERTDDMESELGGACDATGGGRVERLPRTSSVRVAPLARLGRGQRQVEDGHFFGGQRAATLGEQQLQ